MVRTAGRGSLPINLARLVFTLLLLGYSATLAYSEFPHRVWLLGAGLGIVALVSLALPVGWVVPCTVAGVYLGMVLDPPVKGGTTESQMMETATWIVVGTVIGFVVGIWMDSSGTRHNDQHDHDGNAQLPPDSPNAVPSNRDGRKRDMSDIDKMEGL